MPVGRLCRAGDRIPPAAPSGSPIQVPAIPYRANRSVTRLLPSPAIRMQALITTFRTQHQLFVPLDLPPPHWLGEMCHSVQPREEEDQ